MVAIVNEVTKNQQANTPQQAATDSEQTIQAMQGIFVAQKAAFRADPMPAANARIKNLKNMHDAVLHYQDDIIAAISSDFGTRSVDETKLTDILSSLEALKMCMKNTRRWMKPEKRKVGMLQSPGKAKIVYQPLGVVGIIVPWNYPFMLAVGPLANALAAGNRVMIKMSEFTPHTAVLFQKICNEIFGDDHVAVITGEADVAAAFSKIPFDHILFTGSTAVGHHVMRAAAENLTPVTLELGGKSPVIISKDFPMKDAVERMVFGKCFNAGQTCVSPDYLLCPEGRVEDFTSQFTDFVSNMYPTIAENPDFTSIINDRQYARLQLLLTDAKEKGARVFQINPSNEDTSSNRKIPFTLVFNTTEDMTILKEEIFGPILIVIPYKELDDAITYVNDRPRPLALYYFDYNAQRAEYVLNNTHSGGACINDTMSHVAVDDIPFGGIGPSGMGHYHGKEGFFTFSKAKGVYSKGRINGGAAALPPFGSFLQKLIYKLFLR